VDGDTPQTSKARAAVDHLANVGEAVHDRIAGKINDRKYEHVKNILETFEEDFSPHLAAILAHVVDNPEVPAPIRQLLSELTGPQHLTASLGIGIAVGAIVGPVVGSAVAPFIQTLANDVWALHPTVPLSPQEAAAAVIKGVMTQGTGEAWAKESGISPGAFADMVNITGQAIGIVEAVALWRRGSIDDTELARVVHYSNVRSDFLDDIRLLRYDVPNRNEALTGRLKGHLDDATARDMFSKAGGELRNYDWMLASSGRPISPEEMVRLWNRGEATELDVDAAVAQSDINPAYLDFVKRLRWYVPPVRSIMAMLRSGAIDDTRATTLFTENGVRAVDIPGYLAEAHHGRTASVKQLSEAQTLRLYGAKFITNGEATIRLGKLGYNAADITLLLGFADEAQHERYVNAVVTRVHAKYTTYKLTAQEATAALVADQIPAPAIADYLRLWLIERDASVHVLSPAAIVGAYRRHEIPAAECKARLLAVGVQPGDLRIIVADGFAPTKVDPVMVDAVVNA
jgi:hypothetical protein